MRSDNFFKMLRLISCKARRDAAAAPGNCFPFLEAASMAACFLRLAVEFMAKGRVT